jgi:hypothetical protein
MFTKTQFLDTCRFETRVIQHLATKVLPGRLEWRPTPKQRSTLELLRYLTTCAIVPAQAMVSGSWDHAEPAEKAAEAVTAETFASGMDAQMKALEALVAPLSERELLERKAELPWGAPNQLGEALVNTVVKPLVAYRMQLFLYAKESGNADLGPANCWVGVDAPKPPA